MDRFYKCAGGTYFYHEKSKLITDLCEALQKAKKEYKKQPLYFHKVFELDNHNTCEVWDFEIVITKQFKIYHCVLQYWDDNFNRHTVKYCVNDYDKHYDTVVVFENITEFRNFLKREIEKED